MKTKYFGQLQRAWSMSPFLSYWFGAAGVTIYPKIGNLETGYMNGLLPEIVSIAANNSWGVGSYSLGIEMLPECCMIRQSNFPKDFFIGNGAVIAPNNYRTDCTVGVASYLGHNTLDRQTCMRTKPITVLGNPPVEVRPLAPVMGNGKVDDDLYAPTLLQFMHRVFWVDVMRPALAVPPMLFAFYALLPWLASNRQRHWMVFPMTVIGLLFLHAFTFIGLKWLVVGRALDGNHNMWDRFVQRNFFMWNAFPYVAGLWKLLDGTLMLNPLLRALGAQIGSQSLLSGVRRYMDVDMLNIGSNTVIHGAKWQLHTFEGRVLKLRKTHIGNGVLINNAVVMGGATLEDGSALLPASCVLRGQTLLAGALYAGNPAEPHGHGYANKNPAIRGTSNEILLGGQHIKPEQQFRPPEIPLQNFATMKNREVDRFIQPDHGGQSARSLPSNDSQAGL